MAEMLRGAVKWFNDAKGFGFIEHGDGQDVFVHYSVIEWDGFKTLKDGEEVEYELKEGQKGLHAAMVRRPVAEKKRLEKKMADATLVAPNLQSGQVPSTYKPSTTMIDVEKLETENSISSPGSDSTLAEDRLAKSE